jgi:hypothetical protein
VLFRAEYVDLYVRWMLRDSVLSQLKAFIEGFRLLLDSEVLQVTTTRHDQRHDQRLTAFCQLFRPEELELLVCGSQEWDLRDLEKVTLYKAPYTAEHPTIRCSHPSARPSAPLLLSLTVIVCRVVSCRAMRQGVLACGARTAGGPAEAAPFLLHGVRPRAGPGCAPSPPHSASLSGVCSRLKHSPVHSPLGAIKAWAR